jgi:pyruvate/2-oxoglutarate dehydrogenase complex dihydrolipoamide dehydrogenase (E3) component
VIGIEYASLFAALGAKVAVIEQRDRMLEFCGEEVVEALQFHLRSLAVTFRFRETVEAVEPHEGDTLTSLASGKVVAADEPPYWGAHPSTSRLTTGVTNALARTNGRRRLPTRPLGKGRGQDGWARGDLNPHVLADTGT